MKFEIGISQLIAKIVLKQRSLNQLPDPFWKGHIQIRYHFLLIKKY